MKGRNTNIPWGYKERVLGRAERPKSREIWWAIDIEFSLPGKENEFRLTRRALVNLPNKTHAVARAACALGRNQEKLGNEISITRIGRRRLVLVPAE